MPCKTEHEKTSLSCAEQLLALYNELDNWSDDSPARVSFAGSRFLMAYVLLNRGAPADSHLWKLVPKFHLMAHIVADCKICPKDEWSYQFESEIGECAKCDAKVNPRYLSTALIARYRAAHA